jgi:hypothetical protein
MKSITETNNSMGVLVKHGCSQIRLFGFYPSGHGALSFFVAAASLNEAREMVDDYVKKQKPMYNEEWPGEYEVTEALPGLVLINNNS